MQRALATRAVPGAPTEVFGFNGNLYPTMATPLAAKPRQEGGAATNYQRMFSEALAQSGPVFACMLARRTLFSEARFIWQRMARGRPGTTFGSPELALLEKPWANGSTGNLLSRMIDHQGLAGNAFVVKRQNYVTGQAFLKVPRPDWLTIVMGSYDDPTLDAWDLDAEVIGYIYHPGGPLADRQPVPLLVDHRGPAADLSPGPGVPSREGAVCSATLNPPSPPTPTRGWLSCAATPGRRRIGRRCSTRARSGRRCPGSCTAGPTSGGGWVRTPCSTG
jgi:hypothetical protein